MVDMRDREAIQLLTVARRYLELARNTLERVPDKHVTAEQISQRSTEYTKSALIDPENEAFAHLASAAIRLATIAEKRHNRPPGKSYRSYVKKQSKAASKMVTNASKEEIQNQCCPI